MKIPRFFAAAILCISLGSCNLEKVLSDKLGDKVNIATVIAGLKEALELGARNSADSLGRKDGYTLHPLAKVLLPQEVHDAIATGIRFEKEVDFSFLNGVLDMEDILNLLGKKQASQAGECYFCTMGDSLVLALNRAAENAAPRSVDIFVSSIQSMTLDDAMGILKGDSTEARDYLESKTRDSLISLFRPMIREALNVVNADRLWRSFVSYYEDAASLYATSVKQATTLGLQDELPALDFVELPSDLSQWTTDKGLDGLFLILGEEEAKIRRDPAARITDLLEEVFALQDG